MFPFFYLITFNFANFRRTFFSPELLKLIVALEFSPSSSICLTSPFPNLSWKTTSLILILILIFWEDDLNDFSFDMFFLFLKFLSLNKVLSMWEGCCWFKEFLFVYLLSISERNLLGSHSIRFPHLNLWLQ